MEPHIESSTVHDRGATVDFGRENMTFWTAIVVIVGIGAILEIVKHKHKVDAKKGDNPGLSADLSGKYERMEKRLANLETIMLEKEKEQKFRDIEE